MNNKQVAIELTKIYFYDKSMFKTEDKILEIYNYYLKKLGDK